MKTTFECRLRDFDVSLQGNMRRELTLWLADYDAGRAEEFQQALDDLRKASLSGKTPDEKLFGMGRVRVTIEAMD